MQKWSGFLVVQATKCFQTRSPEAPTDTAGGIAVQGLASAKWSLVLKVLIVGLMPLLTDTAAPPRTVPVMEGTSPSRQSADALLSTVTVNSSAAHPAVTAARNPRQPTQLVATPPMSWSEYVRTKGSVPYLVDARTRALIMRCFNTTKNVWLTFDDGYTSHANLNSILETLSRFNVRARFFLVGSWARQHPDMVNQMKRAGHYVEDHTNTHPHLGQISDAALASQVKYGQVSNSSPKLLRPPYGDAMFTTRLSYLASMQGYRVCGWGTDTLDYAGVSAAVIVDKVVHGDFITPPGRPGSVVLMHLTNTQARYALPIMIPEMLAKGLTFDKLR